METVFFSNAPGGGSQLWGLGLIIGAAALGLLVHAVLAWGARRILERSSDSFPLRGALRRRLPKPLRILVPTLFVYGIRPVARPHLATELGALLDGGLYVLLIIATTWLVVAALRAGEEAVAEYYSIDVPDNLQARKIVTQVRILRRIATTVIIVLGVGLVLLQFEPFRELGTGILASAGIVGIVLGIAAQSTLGDLIAGIQIALTQPIRVDDVVIVEGEFGWVEEITLTYVVVRVWDKRRIVLPITHFVEQPFQNWTRTSAELIGSVFLHADYRTPVQAVRDELQRIVEASEYWDGDACALHVTDTHERGIELRAIASAESAPQLWELRCEIREKLVAFLQKEHPEALPVVRAHVQDDGPRSLSEVEGGPDRP
jgi:small-conductance mechanosensitive channel